MREDGLLRIAAAAAAILGVLALVSGSPVVAACTGALAVVVALATLSRTAEQTGTQPDDSSSGTTTGPTVSEGAIDLREDPPPPTADAPPVPAADVATPESAEPGAPQLLDDDYLAAALRGRIAVARRALRPLSVVHILITGGDDGGPVPARLIAGAAEVTLRESDIVGRTREGIYVVVLEDTGEDGAVWTAERLRRHIAGTVGPQRFQAGVASYPNHGLDAESVDASAASALRSAQEWDRDRIEVAVH